MMSSMKPLRNCYCSRCHASKKGEENMIALIIYAPVLVLITVETIVYYWQEADRRSTHEKI